jgi:hypothetical protein
VAIGVTHIGPQVLSALSFHLRRLIIQALEGENSFYKSRIDAIDFTLDGLAVTAARLRGVAAAVKSGKIGVEIDGTAALGAAYSWGPNRHFTLREYVSQFSDSFRALMVHEAVHAAFDINGESAAATNPLIDEACAYLAEAVWIRTGITRFNVGGAPATAAIFTAALDIVDGLRLHKKKGQRLARADVDTLIAALNAHPAYGHR